MFAVGTATFVLIFLITLMSMFPLSDAVYTDMTGDLQGEAVGIGDASQAMGDRILISYTDLIDDLVSFQENPSLERAQLRKQAFINFAQNMTGQFKQLSGNLAVQSDSLTDGGQ